MAKFNYNDIRSIEKDIIEEIGNIGSGHAATALSKLTQDKIGMKKPVAKLVKINKLSDLVGGADVIVTGILITIDGDIEGMMMFLMDETSTMQLSNILLKDIDEKYIEDNDLKDSAIRESGNIITGAYLNALSQLLNMTINPSIPYLSVDMAGAILSVPAIEFGKISDSALIIETEFSQDTNDVTGYFILMPTLDSYDKIMSSLEV